MRVQHSVSAAGVAKKLRLMLVRRGLVGSISVPVRWYSAKTALPVCIGELHKDPPAYGTDVQVQGWIRSVRLQKNVAFIDVNDGTTHESLHCVVPPKLAESLQTGSSVAISGMFVESRGHQQFELKIPRDGAEAGRFSVQTLGTVPENYPLQKKNHTYQFLRTLPHLRWRAASLSAVLRFRSTVEASLVDFFNRDQFYKTAPPIVTGSDCEGAGELFRLESDSNVGTPEKFFGKSAFLTVSTQLHLEVLAMALGRVWTLSPCFRAEESDTNRHLSEFWMLEAEMAFVDDVHQLTKFSERMIKHVVRSILASPEHTENILATRTSTEERDKILGRWNSLLAIEDWPNITYTEAIDILTAAEAEGTVKFQYTPVWGNGLQSEHEKWLAGEYFKSPVAVTDYPIPLKPFYMRPNEDGKTCACYDLLVPDMGELIGGSLREHDPVKLREAMAARGMKSEEIEWYVSLRENGTVPHGGFGMGFERLLCYLADVENIRDVIPFPRHAQSCTC